MFKNKKRSYKKTRMLGLFLLFLTFSTPSYSFSTTSPVTPDAVISKQQEAKYFENRLGVIEVGVTTRELLERYIGEGETIKSKLGEVTYYIDPENKKTLVVETNRKGIIEVVHYKSYIALPPGKKSIAEVKTSKKVNIKNLMTSKGSRMGYNYMRIINAYGRPSVDILEKKNRELKYIMLGNKSADDYVYLEYSFRLQNNQVVEIRIENGK